MEQDKKKENKKEYQRPRLRTIELAADEVLGTGCKNSFSAGENADQCSITLCSSQAS